MLSHHRDLLRNKSHAFTSIFARRHVFIMSHQKKREPVAKSQPSEDDKKSKLQNWAENDDKRRIQEQLLEHNKRLSNLKLFTSGLASYVKHKTDGSLPPNTTFKSSVTETKNRSQVKESKSKAQDEGKEKEPAKDFKAENANISTPFGDIPERIQERLGPATKYLVHKDHQYWELVLIHLQNNGGFNGLKTKEVAKLIRSIPSNQILLVFPIVETLIEDASMLKTKGIMTAYLQKLVSVPVIDSERLQIIESVADGLRTTSEGGKLNTDTFEMLIEAYGKTNNIEKLEGMMVEMKKLGLNPSSRVYSCVLSTSVYKTKDHTQAVQIFDLMKFLAGSMAPKSREYRDIIVSYINNDDIEKSLDLYQEMRDNNIKVDQPTLVALARGCATRSQLKLKAWDFIFEIYELGMKPTIGTLEYMLYLAAKDADLSLARALYQQVIKVSVFNPRALGFLMLAYASSNINESNLTVPAISNHETGRRFRFNILEKVNYVTDLSDPMKAVPFLPKVVLTTPEEVLSESSAILAHALLVNRNAVTSQNVNSFLNIAAKYGSLDEFQDRFEQFSYLDMTGAPQTRLQEDSTVELIEDVEDTEDSVKEPVQTKAPVLNTTDQLLAGVRTGRCTYTYTIALKAAARHKNFDFAEKIWKERGIFRKTTAFTSMSRLEKDKLDFIFATSMVHALTEMNLLDDALAIVVSTEYQFKWTWKELMPLHKAAVTTGYDKVTQTIRGITNRAQIKFEGKIRRKDYKVYVMQNKR